MRKMTAMPFTVSTVLALALMLSATAGPGSGPGSGLGPASAQAGAQQTYPIQLVRAFAAEQQYDLVASASETIRNRMNQAGERGSDQTIRRNIDLEAEVTVTAVDEQGLPTRLALRVGKLLIRIDEQEHRPVEAGQTIIATRQEGVTAFSIQGGGALPAELSEVLAAVVDLVPPPVSLDEVFGSTSPRRVGERWSVDRAAASRLFSHMQLNARSRDVDGHVELAGTAEHDGHHCLELKAELDVSRLSFPPGALPGGMHVQEATVTQRIEGAYPTDKTLPPLRESAVLAMSLHFEGRMSPDEPEVSIRTDAVRRMNWRITPR